MAADGGRAAISSIEQVPNLNTLIDYRYAQHFKAASWLSRFRRQRSGPSGPTITLKVPCRHSDPGRDKERYCST